MIRSVLLRSSALLALTAFNAAAQQRPPIRQLGAVTAKSAEKFNNLVSVRPLSNGAVLVNDVAGRRVIMFDPALSKFTLIADSTSATSNAYSGRMGSLIAFRADSSVFIDPASVSMLVIDPAGKVARVMAIPRAEDAMAIGSPFNASAFDASGRLIYRMGGGRFGGGGANVRTIVGGPGGAGGAGRLPQIPEPPDSAFIARVDLASRKVDTVGVIKIPKVKFEVKSDDRGMSMSSLINPLPVVDDWAITPDGAIAFVRGRDYHVDWLNPDGSKVTSAKIPFDWQRLTDEDKVAFIDSVKAARERQGANAPNPTGAPAIGGGGGQNIQIFMGPGPGGGAGGPGGAAPRPPQLEVNFIPPTDLPDYKPPFFANSTRADMEGNLWIRTIPTSAIAGGPVYDVINRKGEIVERVQIPVGRSIVGFGPGGAVYLLNRDGATATLEKASVR